MTPSSSSRSAPRWAWCSSWRPQRPDAASLPKGVSANVSIRFCLKVMSQVENDMILGTSAYKNDMRATTFRPKVDAGLGYLIGEDPPQMCRTYFLDVTDAKTVIARARAVRERVGTLSGYALGEDTAGPARDALADALEVLGGDRAIHWSALAERLGQRWPERWAATRPEAISAQLRDAGVASVTV